ncbi:MAG: LysM peptidoglycan-binding domain-containing protein [Candidatus Omnitrophica bacterium]|nr:LysM peptidoglycan-binding domain-containing protein [Candidatus Omnitrophota bacterium]
MPVINYPHRLLRGVVLLMLAVCLSSCATPVRRPTMPSTSATALPGLAGPIEGPRHDIFHVVGPGETLWRIGRMYDVQVRDIMEANKMTSRYPVLRKGERLLVPKAASVKPVISLYPSQRWRYIIVHHSATDEGDSLLFDAAHRSKGWDGVGYHFIIDNGSKGRSDGQVEVSPRWLKQLPGAHCKADGMNEVAIGICLVGNFNQELPSRQQMEALVDLVNKLRLYYHIPDSNILGHGQVRGAQTDCPGKHFPWIEFRRRLSLKK